MNNNVYVYVAECEQNLWTLNVHIPYYSKFNIFIVNAVTSVVVLSSVWSAGKIVLGRQFATQEDNCHMHGLASTIFLVLLPQSLVVVVQMPHPLQC